MHKEESLLAGGWLAKYCILKKEQLDLYRHAFDAVGRRWCLSDFQFPLMLVFQIDEDKLGRLSCVETMLALRATNTNLSDNEEEYLYRVRNALDMAQCMLKSYVCEFWTDSRPSWLQDNRWF